MSYANSGKLPETAVIVCGFSGWVLGLPAHLRMFLSDSRHPENPLVPVFILPPEELFSNSAAAIVIINGQEPYQYLWHFYMHNYARRNQFLTLGKPPELVGCSGKPIDTLKVWLEV